MPGEINEDVDLILAHQLRRRVVIDRLNIPPLVNKFPEFIGHPIFPRAGGITSEMKFCAVVGENHRAAEEGYRMIAEVPRHVADPKHAIWIGM